MKNFTVLCLACLASAPLAAQMARQPTPGALLPPGVTPVVQQRLHDPNAEAEAQRMPTPGGPPTDRRPAPLSAGRPSSSDGASVDTIIAALYGSVSHGPDAEPDWPRMRSIFLPVGMLIPPKRPQEDLFTVLDVDGFEDRVKKGAAAAKEKGDPMSFFEREAARRADCFGNVCQIFSTYEARRTPSDEKPFIRGINSIQLVRDGKRWWIASVVWDTERPDNPIPPDYQPKTIPAEYLKK